MFNQTQKILFGLGIGILGLSTASDVSAQQAFASGSSTIVLMNGATQSIGAELAAPSGAMFQNGANTEVTVRGVINLPASGLSRNDKEFNLLILNAGTVEAADSDASFTAAAAAQLSDATNTLSDDVSIIRAGAGVDGLD